METREIQAGTSYHREEGTECTKNVEYEAQKERKKKKEPTTKKQQLTISVFAEQWWESLPMYKKKMRVLKLKS